MNNLAINKRLAELAGECWHSWKFIKNSYPFYSHGVTRHFKCRKCRLKKTQRSDNWTKDEQPTRRLYNTIYTDPANLSALSALVEKLGYKYNLGHLWGETKYFGVIPVVRDRNNDDIISHWGNSNESLNHALALALIAAEKENK